MANKHAVTERALIGRVRRKLAHKDQFIRVTRENSRGFEYLGRHSIWDTSTLVYSHVKLDRLARELGVMHTDETLADEGEVLA
jgi:hypothetical protein